MEPPKVLLCDLGEVVVKIHVQRCTQPIADRFGLEERKVQHLMWGPRHDCNRHHTLLERGKIEWRTYYRYCTALFMQASGRTHLPRGWTQDAFEALWQEVIGDPVEEMMELLEALSRHLIVASASNTNERHYEQMRVGEAGVLRYIHRHTPSHAIGVRKGDEEYFPTLLRHLEVEPQEVVYIDDVPPFTGQAKRQGIRAITLFDHTPDDFAQLRHDLISHGVPEHWLSSAQPPAP